MLGTIVVCTFIFHDGKSERVYVIITSINEFLRGCNVLKGLRLSFCLQDMWFIK